MMGGSETWTAGGPRSLRPQRREQDDVADVLRAREIHEEPVEADADAARGRHAVLHGAQVVLVHPRRLEVAGRPQPRLRLEAPPLVDRVVQLAEGVRELASVREQLEALGERRVPALRL